jgi:hypothetical protein
MKAAEKRARELNQAMLEHKNSLLAGSLKNQLSTQHQSDIGNIKQLDMLAGAGQKEFGDLMNNITNLNKLGSTKWNNNQAENEELYKNYQNENLWEMPHMRNMATQTGRRNAQNEIFSGMLDRNISLDNLANLNVNYSELEKERDKYKSDYNDAQHHYQGDLNNLQQIIDTQKKKLELANKQEALKKQAELDKQNQLKASQEASLRASREQERLKTLFNIQYNNARNDHERLKLLGYNHIQRLGDARDEWRNNRGSEFIHTHEGMQLPSTLVPGLQDL